MSHWVKVKTKLSDLDLVKKALERIDQNHEVATEGKELKVSASGTTERCDIKLHDQLGIRQEEDGTIAFVGDFYYTGISQQKFTQELQGAYCIEDAVGKLEEMGYFVDNEDDLTVNQEGLIEFTATNPHM